MTALKRLWELHNDLSMGAQHPLNFALTTGAIGLLLIDPAEITPRLLIGTLAVLGYTYAILRGIWVAHFKAS